MDIFLRRIGGPAFEGRPQHLGKGAHGGFDGNGIEANAQCSGASGGILQTVLTGIGGRHHDSAYAGGSQRVHGDRRRDGGIDAAGKAENDARKTVLLHIIAQAQHHRLVNPGQAEYGSGDLALGRAPAVVAALPAGQ